MLTAANAEAQECEDIYTELHSITGKRMPIKGEDAFTVEVVKFNKGDKTSKSMVQSAYKLFRGSFGEAQQGLMLLVAHTLPGTRVTDLPLMHICVDLRAHSLVPSVQTLWL